MINFTKLQNSLQDKGLTLPMIMDTYNLNIEIMKFISDAPDRDYLAKAVAKQGLDNIYRKALRGYDILKSYEY